MKQRSINRCKVFNCEGKYEGLGYCTKHYQRRKKNPDLANVYWETVDRLLAKLDINIGDCWIWNGAKFSNHYGLLSINNKNYLTHRIAYALFIGPIPRGLNVLHKCDNPPCCNPAHLFLGTQAENMVDKVKKGRSSKGARNGAAKLDATQVREIKRLLQGSISQREIGSRFGIGQTAISLINTGKNWKHIK